MVLQKYLAQFAPRLMLQSSGIASEARLGGPGEVPRKYLALSDTEHEIKLPKSHAEGRSEPTHAGKDVSTLGVYADD